MPGWLRWLVGAEIAGGVAVVILTARLIVDGISPAGPVTPLGGSSFPTQRTEVATPAVPPPTTAGRSSHPLKELVPGLIRRLDEATAATVRGQAALVAELEQAVVDRLRRYLEQLGNRR